MAPWNKKKLEEEQSVLNAETTGEFLYMHEQNEDKVQNSGKWRLIVVASLAVIGLGWAGFFIHDLLTHEDTEDAYVQGHVHIVSPRITGVVDSVLVKDHQQVHKGDELVRLDPADYSLAEHEAAANYEKARADFARASGLLSAHAISREEYDRLRTTAQVMKARLEQARLQQSYTVVEAPADGQIGKKNVEVGNRVQPGQSLMAVVEKEVYIEANFKETQLANLKPGMKAEINIDAIPGKTFTGTIESISPASGAQFALLPPDNATGNFTKVVQRVPVKVTFDSSIHGYEDRILPGLSAVVKVAIP